MRIVLGWREPMHPQPKARRAMHRLAATRRSARGKTPLAGPIAPEGVPSPRGAGSQAATFENFLAFPRRPVENPRWQFVDGNEV